MDYQVSNSSGLASAVGAAQSGDRILLAGGTYDLRTYMSTFSDTGITITALDPSNRPVFNSITLDHSSGFRFENVDMQALASGTCGANVWSCSNIAFDGVRVSGQMDGSNGLNDGDGIMIQKSTNISVTNSEFRELQTGINHLDSNKLVFSGNYIHNIRLDGVRGGGSSDVQILNNKFTDFFPQWGTATTWDHSDAIQFWTVNTTTSAQNIVISGNVAVRGQGNILEGLFMRDETGGALPYKNVTIANNAFVGASWEGLSIYYADGVTMNGNLLAGYTDQESWMHLVGVKNLSLTGNTSSSFFFDQTTPVNSTANVTISKVAVGDLSVLQTWTETHPLSVNFFSTFNAGTTTTTTTTTSTPPTAATTTTTSTVSAPILAAPTGSDANMKLVGIAGADSLTGAGGNDTISGGDGNDTLVGGLGADSLSGDGGADVIRGEAGNDAINGNAGNDTVSGGAGDDIVRGGAGSDSVSGGDGNDWLAGDKANDTLSGGAGADTFYFYNGAGDDRIVDFNPAEGDRLQLDFGQRYTVEQVGSDVMVTLSGNSHLYLQGMTLNMLSKGWIFNA